MAGDPPRRGKDPPLRTAEPGLAGAAFLSSQKDAAHEFFSNGFFRTMSEDMSSEDMLCDDVTEEVARNTIFNATMTNMDQDSLSNLSLQSGEEEIDKQED